MIAKVRDEYMAAGLRHQIESLSYLIEDMEAERLSPETYSWRIREVELGLQRLREAA